MASSRFYEKRDFQFPELKPVLPLGCCARVSFLSGNIFNYTFMLVVCRPTQGLSKSIVFSSFFVSPFHYFVDNFKPTLLKEAAQVLALVSQP